MFTSGFLDIGGIKGKVAHPPTPFGWKICYIKKATFCHFRAATPFWMEWRKKVVIRVYNPPPPTFQKFVDPSMLIQDVCDELII